MRLNGNKNSWHYRMVSDFRRGHPPANLGAYLGELAVALLCWGLLILATVLVIVGLVIIPPLTLALWWTGLLPEDSWLMVLLALWGGPLWVVCSLYLLINWVPPRLTWAALDARTRVKASRLNRAWPRIDWQ